MIPPADDAGEDAAPPMGEGVIRPADDAGEGAAPPMGEGEIGESAAFKLTSADTDAEGRGEVGAAAVTEVVEVWE